MVGVMARSHLPKVLVICQLALVVFACGGTPPPPARGILDSDLGSWKYRRSQQLLDIEVWVPKNKAVAFTASYVYREALKRGRVADRDVANVFVTRYESNTGVKRALVKFARRLAQEAGYVVEEKRLGGARVFVLEGHGEKWATWASKGHVIKVGGRGIDAVPGDVVKRYAERYPSRLESGLLEGPLPPAEVDPADKNVETDENKKKKKDYDPDNPTPDWDKYEGDRSKN